MRDLKPLEVNFSHGDDYRVDIERYTFKLYRYEFQAWGGSIGLAGLCDDPRIPVPCEHSPDLLKAALKAIKQGCQRSNFRRKILPRESGLKAIIRQLLQADGKDTWQNELTLYCAVTRKDA